MASLDVDSIRHALATAQSNGYRFVRIKSGEESFRGVLSDSEFESPDVPSLAVAEIPEGQPANCELDVRAPCVGYFQEATTPVSVRSTLEPGAVLGVINALGIKNDVTTKKGGEVLEILVKNNDPVEFGQVIARLKVNA